MSLTVGPPVSVHILMHMRRARLVRKVELVLKGHEFSIFYYGKVLQFKGSGSINPV